MSLCVAGNGSGSLRLACDWAILRGCMDCWAECRPVSREIGGFGKGLLGGLNGGGEKEAGGRPKYDFFVGETIFDWNGEHEPWRGVVGVLTGLESREL